MKLVLALTVASLIFYALITWAAVEATKCLP